ncbi:MAG: hypothetical protein HY903_09045 [Deltaproteobacteria bacterium]|nr:hypothetical protein [Deltaproteobacteria bacterium]
MLSALLFVALLQPAPAAGYTLTPSLTPLALTGDDAPADALWLAPKKKVTVVLSGPTKLTLTFVGLADKKSKKPVTTGGVTVKVDREAATQIVFAKAVPGLEVTTKATGAVAAAVVEKRDLALGVGPHLLQISPGPGAKHGVGLVITTTPEAVAPPPSPPTAEVTPDTSPAPEVVAAPPPPPLPAGPAPVESTTGAAAEPDIMAGPAATPASAVDAAGYTFIGPPPPLATIVGPRGNDKLLKVSLAEGLELQAVGPGTMVFTIHAHRDPAVQESMQPVIVGVLVDEILIQTLSVDQPPSNELRFEGETYTPAVRVTLRVPVEPGLHRVRLTLSDSAVLGASIRPELQPLAPSEEPSVVSAEMARARDLRAQAPAVETHGNTGVGLLVGGQLPASLGAAGFAAQLDASFPIPVVGRLAAGLSVAFAQVSDSIRYADPRSRSGASTADIRLRTVPILVEARFAAPVSDPFGVEVGAGGGVMLASAAVESGDASANGGLKALGTAVLQTTVLFGIGPGAVLAKVQGMVSQPLNAGVVRNFSPAGVSVTLGYRLTFGGRSGGA